MSCTDFSAEWARKYQEIYPIVMFSYQHWHKPITKYTSVGIISMYGWRACAVCIAFRRGENAEKADVYLILQNL